MEENDIGFESISQLLHSAMVKVVNLTLAIKFVLWTGGATT